MSHNLLFELLMQMYFFKFDFTNYNGKIFALCFSMKIRFNKILLSAAAAVLAAMGVASAQSQFGGIAEFDKTVHDFGEVLTTDGPLSCKFTVSNISAKPINIVTVVSSCGCTDVTWTREAGQDRHHLSHLPERGRSLPLRQDPHGISGRIQTACNPAPARHGKGESPSGKAGLHR